MAKEAKDLKAKKDRIGKKMIGRTLKDAEVKKSDGKVSQSSS